MRIREASLVSLIVAAINYAGFYLFGWPLLINEIAEWIMAHTPNAWSIGILESLGDWAKPFAMTGGLAVLGTAIWLVLTVARAPKFTGGRRQFLTAALMAGGTAGVALESYLRNRILAKRSDTTMDLRRFSPPPDSFAPGLARPNVNTIEQFYVMSKNTVDPVLDPDRWRLKITVSGRIIRELTFRDLLSVPLHDRYQTLRCISNTLKSDLMSTAYWTGIRLEQLIARRDLPEGMREMAVIGADGHSDSFAVDYAWSPEPLFAIGMNGRTLNRQHGYPLRLLAPRYYGLKHVKWISEIAFVDESYTGTWPKLGYTKEPVIHTCSFIDRIRREGTRIIAAGASFSGHGAIHQVQVRAGRNPWVSAILDTPLSDYSLTRWRVEVDSPPGADVLEARAMDSTGSWQADRESPIFPDGVAGPSIRRIPS